MSTNIKTHMNTSKNVQLPSNVQILSNVQIAAKLTTPGSTPDKFTRKITIIGAGYVGSTTLIR